MSAPPVEWISVALPDLGAPVSLAVRRAGEDRGLPPVLLLHGLGLNSYSFRRLQPELMQSRLTLAVDLPGFGRSEKPLRADYTLPALARGMLALMDTLNIERAAVGAHSLGGGIALLMALTAPERVERLALLGSVAYPQSEPPFLTLPRLPMAWLPIMVMPRRFIYEGLKRVYLNPANLTPDAVHEYASPFHSYAGARAYQELCRAVRPREMAERVAALSGIRTPLLILHGDRDNVVPRWIPERLHREIPTSEYHLLKNVGHMLAEEEPRRVGDMMRRFLALERPTPAGGE